MNTSLTVSGDRAPLTRVALCCSNGLDEVAVADYYANAVAAMEQCESIDQLKDMVDKHEALERYASQAKDDRLEMLARRIRARAIRECGRLIAAFATAPSGPISKTRKAALSRSRYEIGYLAGLSVHQSRTALRLAAIPLDTFELKVESARPCTITQFAAMGTAKRSGGPGRGHSRHRMRQLEQDGFIVGTVISARDEADQALLLMAAEVRKFAALCREHEPQEVATVIDAAEMLGEIGTARWWLSELEKALT